MAQPVWIIEQDGDGFVAFDDSDLPEQGLEESSRLRLVKTWYPGATKASTQVMGTEEGDTVFRGWWRDAWTGLTGGALKQRYQLRQIQKRQRLCELRWGDTISVLGFVREARLVFESEEAIEYEITFDVVEAFDAEVLAIQAVPLATEAEALTVFEQTLQAIEDTRAVIEQFEDVTGVRSSTILRAGLIG